MNRVPIFEVSVVIREREAGCLGVARSDSLVLSLPWASGSAPCLAHWHPRIQGRSGFGYSLIWLMVSGRIINPVCLSLRGPWAVWAQGTPERIFAPTHHPKMHSQIV